MPTQTQKPQHVHIDLGDLRKQAKAKCSLLGITLKDGVRQAVALWVKRGANGKG